MDNKLKIINYLGKNFGRPFTMRELSKATGMPYATFHRTVQKMKELLNIRTVGKSKTLALNAENQAIKSYLAVSSEEEKEEFLKKQPMLNKIASELNTKDIVVLFGSYAKGMQREASDIDLLIINKKGEKSASFSKYELLFNRKINPLFVTKAEFRKMLQEREENVGKQALKDHIILNNPEGFWECALNG